MKQLNVKKLVLLNLPYILLGLFATNLGEAWRLATGADASAKMLSFFSTLPVALGSWWPSLHPLDLAVGLCCGAALRLAVYLKGKNAKKYRHNVEYGSARWGTHEDIAPYIDPVFQNNVILTQTERLTMSSRPKNPKYARNKNVLVIGGSGSGKTRFWLKPNLMQMHSSYVVTDPKGTILVECGKMLQRGAPKLGKDGKPVKDKHGKIVYEPYQIKVLNTINFKKSMHYNPFSYIHSEKDILKLVTTLIANTKGEGKAGDDFWVKAETLLYCALIGYIHYEAPVEEQNFSTLIEMINSMEVREDDEEFKNAVDLMFDELKEREPNHFAVRQYAKYKLAAGKTAKSILVSCGARLAVFDIAELREVTSYDELELDTLGDRRTALFLIMSDTDDSFNFLISMCYTQLFNLLCEKADDVYGGRSMCGASSTSAPTSARSPSWKSWSPPSEAGRFPPAWSCRHRASSRPSTRTTPTPSSATWIPPSSWAARSRPRSRSWRPYWARRPSTPTTPARAGGGRLPTRSTIKNWARR